MTRLLAVLVAVALCLSFWSFVLLDRSPEAAAIVCSIALGLALVVAIVTALMPVAEQRDSIASGPRRLR